MVGIVVSQRIEQGAGLRGCRGESGSDSCRSQLSSGLYRAAAGQCVRYLLARHLTKAGHTGHAKHVTDPGGLYDDLPA